VADDGAAHETALVEALRTLVGADHVSGLVRLSGGASRETWRFEADGRQLILQRQRPGADRDMRVEAAVLRAAHQGGVAVPEVVAAGDDDGIGASYLVLTAVDGETIARKILRDEPFAAARSVLVAQLGATLALLHRLDPDQVPGLADADQLAQYRQILDALGQPQPTFELAFRWLEEHRPTSTRRSVVHGDFRLGNLIVGDDGLRAVLDWELAHVGDPMEDLGWLCVKAWRFGARDPVAGLGGYDELFEAYEVAGGDPVDPSVVRWWEVLGTLKWGIMCILQAHSHLSGLSRSHELAAIGRRVCENEHDLFLLLEGRW
jgi:aminoglycoside phosphotransferase (APT) family kinase protein